MLNPLKQGLKLKVY